MCMVNRFFFLLCLFASHVGASQSVRVTGEAKGYEGRKLAVVALQDELSAKRILLAQCDVADNGTFNVSFDVGNTQRVYLHIQRIEAPLYVQPGKTYSIVFPTLSKVDYKRFDNTEVNLQFKDLPEDDINTVIRRFNLDYAEFVSEHFYDFASDEYRGSPEYLKYIGNKKEKVDLYTRSTAVDSLKRDESKGFTRWVVQFEDSVYNSKEPSSDSLFTEAYKRFSIAELHLLSGMNRRLFYERYFMSIQPLERNPAFASCFKLFTRNVLVGQKAPVQTAIIRAINVDRDLVRLSEALSSETYVQSDRLKRLAVILGLKDVYNNKSFDRASIDILLGKVSTGDTLVDALAEATLYQLKRCKQGWPISDFVFTDETQERWSIQNADGLPVYMLFFATWSPASLKEILVLERWQEKFRGRVQFVAICMDDEYRSYRKYLEDNMKLPLKLLYGNAEPFVQEKFNLKAIPHQVMLDTDGVVVADTCPLPSDPMFESFINRISKAEQPVKQGPKTWKDH